MQTNLTYYIKDCKFSFSELIKLLLTMAPDPKMPRMVKNLFNKFYTNIP